MILLSRLFIILLSVLTVGCASNYVTPDEYSGYLSSYEGLEKVDTESGGETLRWISEKISSQNYHSVLVDKTVLYPEPQATEQVTDTLLRQFSWTVSKMIEGAAADSFKLVTGPGEGVLRIKSAITGVVHSMEGMKPLEILPVAMVLGLGKAAFGTRDRDVSVFLEVEVTDSQTGELLATAVRKGEGEQLENDKQKLTMVHLEEMVANWKVDTTSIFKQLAK